MTVYNKASLVLAESPAYKAGKIQPYYPLTPDVSFDFTRATSATRVNASGNIEKETQNLLTYSNTLTNGVWSKGGTLTSGQSDKDGGTDAYSFTSSSPTSGLHRSFSTGGVQTFSAYFKKDATNGVRMYAFGSTNAAVFFDLNNGAVVSEQNVIDAKIEAYNSTWWRASITFNSTLTLLYFYATNNGTTQVTGTFTIQDIQLEQGLVARDYIETTTTAFYGGITDNIPRLDYTDSSCPALLLEPQRTNSVGNSELINPNIDSTWKQLGVNTFTTNYGTSPEGKQNSTLIQFGGTNSAYQVYYEMNFSAGDYTTSIYAKGSGSFKYGIYDNTSILTDTITLTSEWQRFEVTKTALAASNGRGVWIYPNGDGNTIEVWGGQVEAGSYATSYIPTYGTSVTRSTDNMTGSPLSIYGLFGATEGSIFLEFTNPLPSQLANNSFYFTGLGGASSGYQRIRGYWQFYFPGLTFSPTGNLGNVKGHSKILAKWGNGSIKLFTDGVEEAASTYTGGDINMNGRLENIVGSYDFAAGDSRIKTMLFFSEAPTDDECIALTTL